ncbi:Transposon Tf2-9 polyprotein, partial [Araneus ventricosus]
QTCSWFRRYVPNFANIARPLSNLTKKNVQWFWGPEQQDAFETLRKSLITPPVLKQPDGSKPFRIRTDASSYAFGAVLTQGEGPEEHVIEYASRLLIPAERNYSTTEREALAVVWALEKFRGYVESQEIIIASDHQPLKWLMTIKSPSGRLARWALQIQSFNPKIEYTPGKANVLADMLSRPTNLNEDVPCDIFAVSADFPVRKSKDIRQEQLKDEELKKIIDCFENSSKDENFANWTSRGYLMTQGILYRYSPEVETEEAQLVVPFQERERVLQQYHDVPTAGHYGAEGTYNKVASRYYFPGMRKYIAEYVKNCPDCNRYKPSNQKPTGLLRTPVYAQRFETLAIDLFGPLPETSSGKKWIFLVEDTSTKWVELFALKEATSVNCAKTLVEEVFLRYGLPRRLISDNGPQFISAVMQQTCNFLGIKQDLIPVYHPQANPSERKNRDLKPRLAILVRDEHDSWEEKLPMIRFALNTAKCETTNHTAAFLQFGRVENNG